MYEAAGVGAYRGDGVDRPRLVVVDRQLLALVLDHLALAGRHLREGRHLAQADPVGLTKWRATPTFIATSFGPPASGLKRAGR